MLTAFYAAMGNPPEARGALGVMATALAQRAEPKAINAALNRCMTECRYPVRLPDIFQRIPGFDVDLNAEKRLAWDTLEKFVRKYVSNDVFGNYGPEHGSFPQTFPQLAPRLLDTVRRTGGWRVYKSMTDEDFPHQQKRFFEEYEAWSEIQHVAMDPGKLLEMPRAKKYLQSKAMDPPQPVRATMPPAPNTNRPAVRDLGQPATPEQIRDRAATAKAWADNYLKSRQTANGGEVRG